MFRSPFDVAEVCEPEQPYNIQELVANVTHPWGHQGITALLNYVSELSDGQVVPIFPTFCFLYRRIKKNVSIVLLHMVNLSSGSLPRPQTHKIKQAANICEILGNSLELSEFQ